MSLRLVIWSTGSDIFFSSFFCFSWFFFSCFGQIIFQRRPRKGRAYIITTNSLQALIKKNPLSKEWAPTIADISSHQDFKNSVTKCKRVKEKLRLFCYLNVNEASGLFDSTINCLTRKMPYLERFKLLWWGLLTSWQRLDHPLRHDTFDICFTVITLNFKRFRRSSYCL